MTRGDWLCAQINKTGLTSRNWSDSAISLDERQIKESRGSLQSLLPLSGWSRRIEGDSARRVHMTTYGKSPSIATQKTVCSFTLGSLSMQRFWATDGQTDTRSLLFSYFTCLHTTTFILLSFFALVETITSKIWERHMAWGPFLESPENFSGPKSHS